MPLLFVFLCVGGCAQFFSDPSIEYTVKRGDTLGRIAKAHDVTVAELRAWNGISGDLIEVDQVLMIRTEAPAPSVASAKKTRPTKRRKQRKSAQTTGLKRPPKKRCLAGPSLDSLSDDVPDIQSSMGLNYEQIQAPMAQFLPKLGRCFDGAWPEARVHFELTAGCDGRVSKVVVLDGGGVAASELECMRTTLSFVGFPAHDMPDGMTFQYPVVLGN